MELGEPSSYRGLKARLLDPAGRGYLKNSVLMAPGIDDAADFTRLSFLADKTALLRVAFGEHAAGQALDLLGFSKEEQLEAIGSRF